LELFEKIKTDKRFKELHAVVLLGLKKCGRAKSGYDILPFDQFEILTKEALKRNIGIGYDSCSCNKAENVFTNIYNQKVERVNKSKFTQKQKNFVIEKEKDRHETILQMCEPCESGLFSSYSNTAGVYHHCSFAEHTNGFDLLNGSFENYWKSEEMNNWRGQLKASNRSCPIWEV
jgi:hypothetical protein